MWQIFKDGWSANLMLITIMFQVLHPARTHVRYNYICILWLHTCVTRKRQRIERLDRDTLILVHGNI
jgi:hypothetical protein